MRLNKIVLSLFFLISIAIFAFSFKIIKIDSFILRIIFNMFSTYIFVLTAVFSSYYYFKKFPSENKKAYKIVIIGLFFVVMLFGLLTKNQENTLNYPNYYTITTGEVRFGDLEYSNSSELMIFNKNDNIIKEPITLEFKEDYHKGKYYTYYKFYQTAFLNGEKVSINTDLPYMFIYTDFEQLHYAVRCLPYFWLENFILFFNNYFNLTFFVITLLLLVAPFFIKNGQR